MNKGSSLCGAARFSCHQQATPEPYLRIVAQPV